jgi:hypothetical protein
MKLTITTVLAGLGLACTAALAQPSIYYLWKHNSTGQTKCEPEAPSAAWTKASGPFQDPNCKTPMPQ